MAAKHVNFDFVFGFTASCCPSWKSTTESDDVCNMLQALLKAADMKENVTGKSVEGAAAAL